MTPGSSKLTPEQSDWFTDKLSERYVAIQETPWQPSRKLRRLARFKPRKA